MLHKVKSLCVMMWIYLQALSHPLLTYGSSQIIKENSITGSQDVISCAGLQVANKCLHEDHG